MPRICSLLRIMAFIRQCKLEDKTMEDISQILEFGFVAWDFILVIYESGWKNWLQIRTINHSGNIFLLNFKRALFKNITLSNVAKDK